MKNISNKKGQEGSSLGTVIAFILGAIVLGIIAYMLITASGKNNTITNSDCGKGYGGFCAKSILECGENYEPEVLGKCSNGLTCCKPKVTESLQSDLVCKDKKQGEQCGDASANTVCNQNFKCVTKCEYCKDFPNDPVVCYNQKNSKGIVVEFNSKFSCKCTLAQCNEKEGSGDCIKGFCGQSNPNYCCE